MAADIVNLRRARKDRQRRAKEKEADANRRRFGMTKAERQLRAARDETAERRLEGHRLTRTDDSE